MLTGVTGNGDTETDFYYLHMPVQHSRLFEKIGRLPTIKVGNDGTEIKKKNVFLRLTVARRLLP